VELVTKVEEETRRLAREATRRGEAEVGGNQEVREVGSVDFSSDGRVVAGRAGVLENGAAIGSNPDETENSSVQGARGGAEVVDGQQDLCKVEDFGKMESRVGGIADSNDGGGEQGSGGDEVVMGRRRGLRGAEGADVDDGALKCPA
jgi:hypothetical protein